METLLLVEAASSLDALAIVCDVGLIWNFAKSMLCMELFSVHYAGLCLELFSVHPAPEHCITLVNNLCVQFRCGSFGTYLLEHRHYCSYLV